jgi:acyl-CoA reductase-like NAD-dependent aldehyde dehydrogenase
VLVGGKLRGAATTKTFAVENPADLAIIGEVPRCGALDVEQAVQAAQLAFPGWSAVPARERGRMLAKVADLLEAESEQLARLLCLETGNAFSTQARPEVGVMVDVFRFFAGLAGELKGRTVPWPGNVLCYTTRDPLGVVAAIIPWNAPLFLTATKLGPALVAGNTVVLKTAEQAPLAVLRCFELMQEILPPGVTNVLSGFGDEAGKPLAEHPLVKKVSFTGSSAVGQVVLHYAADKICPVTLELGGKSPNVVMPDADLDRVIPGIVLGMRFTRQGQSCSAGTRLFLHEEIYDEVLERVVGELAKLRIGDPMDEATEIGAIISREQFERVVHYVELARGTPGARILCGGSRPRDPELPPGYFYAPTLIDGLPHASPACQDEIFGPVAIAFPWRDFDAMIEQANDTRYGLAAGIWTRDLGRAMSFARRIQAGFVQVNQYIAPQANISYGGLKMSGLGKENTLEAMLEHFTCSKTVMINPGAEK